MWCIIHSNIWVQLQSYHRMWHNITIILHHRYNTKCENIKRYTIMNSTKGAHEFREGKLERHAGGLEGRASDGQPMIHATTALLWSESGRAHKFKAPKSGHEDPGESELPNVGWCECQMACNDKHTVSINPNHKDALRTVSWAQTYRSK